MQKWEYRIAFSVISESRAAFVAQLNRLGDEGWEAGGIYQAITENTGNTEVLLKRPKR